MKKAFLLLTTIAFLCISCFGQINRTIWGFSLGMPKNQVVSNLKSKGYVPNSMSGGDISILMQNVSLGGGYWNYANFKFVDNKLYCICFQNNNYQCPMDIYTMFDTVKNNLLSKYSQYTVPMDNYAEKHIDFSDGTTWLYLAISSDIGKKYINITYFDEALEAKFRESCKSEL